MSLIHHAMCQQTYMESISNLFNEKQLSSKLEATKSLKTIWACMFWLCNKFLVKWLVRGHVFETTQGRHISPEGRQNQCVPTQGFSTYSNCRDFKECVCVWGRIGIQYALYVCACWCFDIFLCVCASVCNPSQEAHHQLSRRPLWVEMFCIVHYVSASEVCVGCTVPSQLFGTCATTSLGVSTGSENTEKFLQYIIDIYPIIVWLIWNGVYLWLTYKQHAPQLRMNVCYE